MSAMPAINETGETIAYNELVFDFDLYPRMEIDAERVGMLKDALETGGVAADVILPELIDSERVDHLRHIIESGGVLPPIVVDRQSRKVIDGFYRSRAYFSLHGSSAAIPCVFHEYEDKAAMFLDAVRLNASHGKPLTRRDQERCIALAEMFSVNTDVLASVMNVKAQWVADMWSAQVKAATLARVQPMRTKSPSSHAILTSGGNHARVEGRPLRTRLFSIADVNEMIAALRTGQLHLRDPHMRVSVKLLVKTALEKLRETEGTA